MAESVPFELGRLIKWKVGNILSVRRRESEVFRFSGLRWYFKLVKVVKIFQSAKVIKMYLNKADMSITTLSAFATSVCINDVDGNAKFTHLCSAWCSGTCVWETDYESFREWKDKFLKDDDVTLSIVLSPETIPEDNTESDDESDRDAYTSVESVNEVATNVETDGCLWMDFSVERLTLDFRHLLDDGTHSDVTLKCGGTIMPAHSCILSARSKVFAAMLRNDMVERRNRVIEISDMDPPVLSQFLHFIYSGKLSDLSMNTAPELYAAGDKYDIGSLKRQCLVFLQKNLAVGNVCSILTLAEAHCDRDLKESTIAFILNNQLMKNDEIWLKFCDDHPKLAIEILNRSYKEGSVSSTSGSSLCYKCASVPSGLNLVP